MYATLLTPGKPERTYFLPYNPNSCFLALPFFKDRSCQQTLAWGRRSLKTLVCAMAWLLSKVQNNSVIASPSRLSWLKLSFTCEDAWTVCHFCHSCLDCGASAWRHVYLTRAVSWTYPICIEMTDSKIIIWSDDGTHCTLHLIILLCSTLSRQQSGIRSVRLFVAVRQNLISLFCS